MADTKVFNDMDSLKAFRDELVSIFASSAETEMGFLLLVDWLNKFSKEQQVDLSFPIQLGGLGGGNPGHPSSRYQYEKPLGNLIRDSTEEGRNVHLHRNGVISLTYALWQENYRGAIAKECRLASKNSVKSEVFQDLNKYRQAILHRSGKLGRHPEKMTFFSKGEVVSFTKIQMHELFTQLVAELNRIGEEYYGHNPGFRLDMPIPPSSLSLKWTEWRSP